MVKKINIKEKEIPQLIDELEEIIFWIAKHKEKQRSGFPDYSGLWSTYLIPLTLLLLKTEKTLQKLTLALIFLTGVLIILTILTFLS